MPNNSIISKPPIIGNFIFNVLVGRNEPKPGREKETQALRNKSVNVVVSMLWLGACLPI
jgi:hypothetical protein